MPFPHRTISVNVDDGFFETEVAGGDFEIYLAIYCIAAFVDLVFIINILKDKDLRGNHGNWFPLASVTSMFINMILMMTGLIGTQTSATSWNNITTVLCPILFTLTAMTQNWPSAYIIVTIIGRLLRYKKGDPSSPAYPAKRSIINLCSSTITVAAITVIVVFVAGDGIVVEGVPGFDKEECFIQVTQGISDAQAGFHAFMMTFMLTTSSFLIYFKTKYHSATGTPWTLDTSVALLITTAIWFCLFLPFIVVAGVAGPSMTADLYQYYRGTELAFTSSFAITPLAWLILDPNYRRSLSRLCCPCCSDKSDDPERTGLLSPPFQSSH